MIRVKICGIREKADALVAAEAGADLIGLVFVPTAWRRVDTDGALHIVSSLRDRMDAPPKVVGLFADQPLEQVERIVRECALDMVQLCGGETLHYCAKVGAPVIRVLHVGETSDAETTAERLSLEIVTLRDIGHLVALDRESEGLPGGTGIGFNREVARSLSNKGLAFMLAGGLNPENVGEAVSLVRPWGWTCPVA